MITATAGKVKATCKVTVANPVYKVTSIKLAAAPSRYITAGKRVQLRATITPSNATNKAVTWKSSNTRIATVSSTGIVTFNKNAGGKKSPSQLLQRWQQEICKNHPCLHERFCKEHQAFRKNYRYQRSVHKSNRSRYFSGRKRKQITCMVFQQYKTCYR